MILSLRRLVAGGISHTGEGSTLREQLFELAGLTPK